MSTPRPLPFELVPLELVPPVTASEPEPALDAIAPPFGKRCRRRGCERPATCVAGSASESSYPLAYCERDGRRLERKLGRQVTYFPVCAIEECEELASTLALIHATPTRSEWLLVCDVHRD
jgi:hypothetical protein